MFPAAVAAVAAVWSWVAVVQAGGGRERGNSMGSALGALLAALLLCGASRAQVEGPVGGASPEPEPPEEPEPEPEPEPKYERIEVHSGSTFFSNYDFVQWAQDKTTHGVASYAVPETTANGSCHAAAMRPANGTDAAAQIRGREGGETAPYDSWCPSSIPAYC